MRISLDLAGRRVIATEGIPIKNIYKSTKFRIKCIEVRVFEVASAE